MFILQSWELVSAKKTGLVSSALEEVLGEDGDKPHKTLVRLEGK